MVAWREGLKTKAVKEKRADEIQIAQIKAAKDQAKMEKELAFKEIELKVQAQTSTDA